MKKSTLALVAVLLVLVCISQQVWIFSQRRASPTQAVSSPPPPVTYDIELISRSLQKPEGGKGLNNRESHRLQGAMHGTTGFEACLWIDTSEVEFEGRAKTLRGERVAAVAAYYAKQIATVIPGAVIECALDRPGIAEASSLHSTFLVKHPLGCIVVSAGYQSTSESEQRLSDVMKVHVISSNHHGSVRRGLHVGKTLLPDETE